MTLSLNLLQKLTTAKPEEAWRNIFSYAQDVCCLPLEKSNAASEVVRRDGKLADLDLFLASAGWDLWQEFDNSVEHTAEALINWWQESPHDGKAVLILDALSLRESPWIIEGAKEHGYNVQYRVTAAELPADTTQFARSLGFSQRSSLQNNGAGNAHRLTGAQTESLDWNWHDCIPLVGAKTHFVLWHHFPDYRLHDYAGSGQSLQSLTTEVMENLTSEDFWKLIETLTNGRKLVITADHGYAATGHFPNTNEAAQKQLLKETYSAGRWANAAAGNYQSRYVPPLDLELQTRHGRNRFVLGRRKWSVQGGYPTLAHGGLSVLEVAVPFIEISR